jgi:hypothetical protein
MQHSSGIQTVPSNGFTAQPIAQALIAAKKRDVKRRTGAKLRPNQEI